jgi:hypothetical protein
MKKGEKLKLNNTTLRRLTSDDLQQVVGGLPDPRPVPTPDALWAPADTGSAAVLPFPSRAAS